MRCVFGYVLGVVAASFLFWVVTLAMSLAGDHGMARSTAVVGSTFSAVIVGLLALPTAWLPFALVVAVGRWLRMPSLAFRAAAGVVTALALEPVFLVLDRAMMSAVAAMTGDPGRFPQAFGDAVAASLGSGAILRVMLAFAPWTLGYGLVGALVYHVVVARRPKRRRGAPAVFA